MGKIRRFLGFFAILFMTLTGAIAADANYDNSMCRLQTYYYECNDWYDLTDYQCIEQSCVSGHAKRQRLSKEASGTTGITFLDIDCPKGYYCQGPQIRPSESKYTPAGHIQVGDLYACAKHCPEHFRDGPTNLSSEDDCETSITAGKYKYSTEAIEADCPSGFYCKGGNVKFSNYIQNNELGGRAYGIEECPSGFTSSSGAMARSQCTKNGIAADANITVSYEYDNTLQGSSVSNAIYLKYGDGWYSDSNYKNKLTSFPTLSYSTSSFGGHPVGIDFIGWHTKPNCQGELVTINNTAPDIDADHKLYACLNVTVEAGYSVAQGSFGGSSVWVATPCTGPKYCTAATYANPIKVTDLGDGVGNFKDCLGAYLDGTGVQASQTDCQMYVEGGYKITSTGSSTTVLCGGNGKYCEPQYVNYGQISEVQTCPTGFTLTKANASAITDCYVAGTTPPLQYGTIFNVKFFNHEQQRFPDNLGITWLNGSWKFYGQFNDYTYYTGLGFQHNGESTNKLPLPTYSNVKNETTTSSIVQRGWYTEEKCGGTQITDASGRLTLAAQTNTGSWRDTTALYECIDVTIAPGDYAYQPASGEMTIAKCKEGAYCPGLGTVHVTDVYDALVGYTQCPTAYPNTASTGAKAITECFSNPRDTVWTQIDPTLPPGCASMTTANCADTSATYTVYSNEAGTGDGTIKSDKATDSCTKEIASLTANEDNYVNGTTSCPACSTLAGGLYPNSAAGNSGGTSACKTNLLVGQYIATANATTATDCGTGKYQEGIQVAYGSTSTCKVAQAGSFAPGPRTEQAEKCPIGSYSEGTGNSTCTVCPAGKTTAAAGTSSENDCIPCDNSENVDTWREGDINFSWSQAIGKPAGNVSSTYVHELCTIKTCVPGYELKANACVPGIFEIGLKDGYSTEDATVGVIYEKYADGWYYNSGATTRITNVPVPTRPNYNFKGYVDRTGAQMTDDAGKILVANTKYTAPATWTATWELAIVRCQTGKYYNATTGSFETCRAGQYCDGNGDTRVITDGCFTACPTVSDGVLSDATGLEKATQCQNIRTGVTVNPAGNEIYGLGTTTCNYDESSKSYVGSCSIVVTQCNGGYWHERTDAPQCAPVGKGNYSVAPLGRNSCTDIKAGATTDDDYASSVMDCFIACPDIPLTIGNDSVGTRVSTDENKRVYATSAGIINACTYEAQCNAGYHQTADHLNCEPDIYTVPLDHSGGAGDNLLNAIYLKYNTGWYSDAAATKKITSVPVPEHDGYTFHGYTIKDIATIIVTDKNGFITGPVRTLLSKDTPVLNTATAQWMTISYTTCEAGTYNNGTGKNCAPCPAGSFCEGGTTITDSGVSTPIESCGNVSNTPTGAIDRNGRQLTPVVTSDTGAKYASECYATNVPYVNDAAEGSQTCKLNVTSRNFEIDCTDKKVYRCAGGYYYDSTWGVAECRPVGIGNYSPTDSLDKTVCPNGATTASETTAEVTLCYQGNIWYEPADGHNGQRRNCYYNTSTKRYDTNCNEGVIVSCAAGYYLANDTDRDCRPV
ncbi:hypothetical protein HDR66_02480, partial [bacterium]|nr:hypothetical protein [bacterium]